MTSGIAVRLPTPEGITDQPPPMYRLYPSRGMDEASHQFVVAKMVPAREGVPQPHLTLMFCDASGNTGPYVETEALPSQYRLVDNEDVDQTIANLGYVLVMPEDLPELEVIGKTAAVAWYRENISVPGEQDYAENNWGLFAAEHLIASQRAAIPKRRTNSVPWKQHQAYADAKARQERAVYRDYLFG